MSEIKPGSRVRVTFEGTYLDEAFPLDSPGWRRVRAENGDHHRVPWSSVEVLSPPLPEQPPVGTYVEVQWAEATLPDVLQRVTYHGVSGTREGWETRWGNGPDLRSWADLHQDGAKVTVLVPAGEDRGEYERATHAGFTKWMHACGAVTALASDVDPNAGGDIRRWCSVYRCHSGGQFTPLYVRSGSDAD